MLHPTAHLASFALPTPKTTLLWAARLLSLALVATFSFSVWALVAAHAVTPDPDFMEMKGYSPEMVRMMNVSRSRNEWRGTPPPVRSPLKQILHNIWHNHPAGMMDEMGYTVIRDDSGY